MTGNGGATVVIGPGNSSKASCARVLRDAFDPIQMYGGKATIPATTSTTTAPGSQHDAGLNGTIRS